MKRRLFVQSSFNFAMALLAGLVFGSQSWSSPLVVGQKQTMVAGSTRVQMEVEVPRSAGASKLDVLFVIDDSGSMAQHQANLLANVDALVNASLRSGVDLHVGVVTTTTDLVSVGSVPGRLVASPNRFADSSTPTFKSDLKSNLKAAMTVNGSGIETPFDAVVMALSEPLLSGENKDFKRTDAALAIVILTDADDQSKVDAKTFIDFLRKMQSAASVSVYGAYVPSKLGQDPGPKCSRDNATVMPVKIEEVLSAFGTMDLSVNLCDADFASKFSKIGDGMAVIGLRQVQLSLVPDLSTMKLQYGANTLPAGDMKRGWTYDVDQNALILGDRINWSAEPAGTKLLIDYIAK